MLAWLNIRSSPPLGTGTSYCVYSLYNNSKQSIFTSSFYIDNTVKSDTVHFVGEVQFCKQTPALVCLSLLKCQSPA